MWYWLGLVLLAATLAAYVAPASIDHDALKSSDLKAVPIAALAQGRPAPSIGLLVPAAGVGAAARDGACHWRRGAYPPQPPYGAAFSMMVALDEAPDDFIMTGHRRRLAVAGFKLQTAPNPMIPTDVAKARFKATNAAWGPVTYFLRCARRGTGWFMQITFWDGLVPL